MIASPYRDFHHRPAAPKACWSERIEESPQVSALIVQEVCAQGCVAVCDRVSSPRPDERSLRNLPLRHPYGNAIDPRSLPEFPRRTFG